MHPSPSVAEYINGLMEPPHRLIEGLHHSGWEWGQPVGFKARHIDMTDKASFTPLRYGIQLL